VSGPSAGAAALAALAARLSNAAAPLSLSACASAYAGGFPSAASLRRLLLVFFFTLGGSNGGCLVPDEEEGGGVEINSLSLSVGAGEGGGVCLVGAITGCLVAEEEGRSVCDAPPSICGCATEPLLSLLPHLLADLELFPCLVWPILVLL
jgi:hypothetical protein